LLATVAQLEERHVVETEPTRVEAMINELLAQADRMTSILFRLTSKQMDKADLSPNRFNALRALTGGEQLTMSGLSERLQVSTAAVTSIVDKLEAEQFVRRSRGKEDRRQVFVQITPRGRDAVQSILDVRADLIRYMFENVSPEMQQHWLELYREFGRLLEKKAAAALRQTEGTD
jgi:DNA-binding MarR family transcriptional regulator